MRYQFNPFTGNLDAVGGNGLKSFTVALSGLSVSVPQIVHGLSAIMFRVNKDLDGAIVEVAGQIASDGTVTIQSNVDLIDHTLTIIGA